MTTACGGANFSKEEQVYLSEEAEKECEVIKRETTIKVLFSVAIILTSLLC